MSAERTALREYVKKHNSWAAFMERSSEYVRPAADANAAILYKMQKGVS